MLSVKFYGHRVQKQYIIYFDILSLSIGDSSIGISQIEHLQQSK